MAEDGKEVVAQARASVREAFAQARDEVKKEDEMSKLEEKVEYAFLKLEDWVSEELVHQVSPPPPKKKKKKAVVTNSSFKRNGIKPSRILFSVLDDEEGVELTQVFLFWMLCRVFSPHLWIRVETTLR